MSAILRMHTGGYGVQLCDGQIARFRSRQWASYFVDQLNHSIYMAEMEKASAKVREIMAKSAGTETMPVTGTAAGQERLEREFLAQHGNPRAKDVTVTVLPNPAGKP